MSLCAVSKKLKLRRKSFLEKIQSEMFCQSKKYIQLIHRQLPVTSRCIFLASLSQQEENKFRSFWRHELLAAENHNHR